MWGISKCFQEVMKYEQQHGHTYDIVVRFRPDLHLFALDNKQAYMWKRSQHKRPNPNIDDTGRFHMLPGEDQTPSWWYDFNDEFFIANHRAVPAVADFWRQQYLTPQTCLGAQIETKYAEHCKKRTGCNMFAKGSLCPCCPASQCCSIYWQMAVNNLTLRHIGADFMISRQTTPGQPIDMGP
jgi:hypothetical protein